MENKSLIDPTISALAGKRSLLEMFSLLREKVSRSLVAREVFIRITIEETFERLGLNTKSFRESLEAKKELLLIEFFRKVSIDPGNEKQLKRFLRRSGETLEDIFEKVVYEEKILALKKSLVSETNMREFFIKNHSNQQRVNVFIFLFAEETLGEEVRRIVIEEHLDFVSFVQEIVESKKLEASAKFTGLVDINSLNPEIIKQVNKIKLRQVSKVFGLKDKFSMIKLVEVELPEMNQKFREEVQDSLFREWLSEQIRIGSPKLVESKED